MFSFVVSEYCYSMLNENQSKWSKYDFPINNLDEINHPIEELEKCWSDYLIHKEKNSESEENYREKEGFLEDLNDNGEFWRAWLSGDFYIPFLDEINNNENMNRLEIYNSQFKNELDRLNQFRKGSLIPLSKYCKKISGKPEDIGSDYSKLKKNLIKTLINGKRFHLIKKLDGFYSSIIALEKYVYVLLQYYQQSK